MGLLVGAGTGSRVGFGIGTRVGSSVGGNVGIFDGDGVGSFVGSKQKLHDAEHLCLCVHVGQNHSLHSASLKLLQNGNMSSQGVGEGVIWNERSNLSTDCLSTIKMLESSERKAF